MWHLISEKILAELLGYLTASNPWNHVVDEATNRTWQQALEKNNWTPALLTGAEFEKFVDDEFASLRATMAKSGMI